MYREWLIISKLINYFQTNLLTYNPAEQVAPRLTNPAKHPSVVPINDAAPDAHNLYEVLRDGLIWGRWKPGEKLKPQHLKEELGCKSAALREALIRLAGEGFVDSELNQGFRAVEHSKETFQEAVHMRWVLECEAVRMALKNGGFEWEMAVSAAHKKLVFVEERMKAADDVTPFLKHWSRQDWEFHNTVLSACHSTLLLRSYKTAYDTFRMYAVSSLPTYGFGGDSNIAEHNAIYEAAIQHDEAACIEAIKHHLPLLDDKAASIRPSQD